MNIVNVFCYIGVQKNMQLKRICPFSWCFVKLPNVTLWLFCYIRSIRAQKSPG